MALKLIRRGPRLHPAQVTPGSGWVNVTAPGSTKPYFIGAADQRLTVTASNCGGVRIYDWGKDPNWYTESTPGSTLHSAVALVSNMGLGPVVRVLNPTKNTEVTIMSEPLPPPLPLSRFAPWRWLPWR